MALRLVDYSSDDSSSSGGNGSGRSTPYCQPNTTDPGHVKGGWSGHVYLQLQPIPALTSLITTYHSTTAASHIITNLHISLTRPFYLQEHQISSFVSALQRQVAGFDTSSLVVAFGGASIYHNETQTRSFVALDVDMGVERIQRLLEDIDSVMGRFNKPRFYQDPRFHASMVWFDKSEAKADTGRLGELARELPGILADRLVCVVGDKEFAIF